VACGAAPAGRGEVSGGASAAGRGEVAGGAEESGGDARGRCSAPLESRGAQRNMRRVRA
jgi:hypothetical protein